MSYKPRNASEATKYPSGSSFTDQEPIGCGILGQAMKAASTQLEIGIPIRPLQFQAQELLWFDARSQSLWRWEVLPQICLVQINIIEVLSLIAVPVTLERFFSHGTCHHNWGSISCIFALDNNIR